MLTYQLQDRVFKLEGDRAFCFPSKVCLEVKLGPARLFGKEKLDGRVLLKATAATFTYNANTGRGFAEPQGQLEPLDVRVESPNAQMRLEGDLFRYTGECDDEKELVHLVQGLLYGLVPLVNMDFPEPPVVEWIRGRVGTVPFRYEHSESRLPFEVVTKETLEERFAAAMARFELVSGSRNRRLLAGAHYFHIARRLLEAGYSQWEFMPEAILNLEKALTIMFGNLRDQVRKELTILGYSDTEIESDFIPVMILRSKFDVGHPRLAILKQAQLNAIYHYLTGLEPRFKKLFVRICEAINNKEYEMREHDDIRLDQTEQDELDKLVASMSAATGGATEENA